MSKKKNKDKSIADFVDIKDTAFPLKKENILLSHISNCPKCGAPIYGHSITADENPPVKFSCSCNVTPTFGMRTT